jgi:hypothetical protein
MEKIGESIYPLDGKIGLMGAQLFLRVIVYSIYCMYRLMVEPVFGCVWVQLSLY